MNTIKSLLVTSAAFLAVSGAAIAASAGEPTLTASQHRALAREFEAKAVDASGKAAAHEAMARTYRTGGSPKWGGRAMTSHCERLVRGYRAEAAEYQTKATEHSKLGAAAR